MEIYTEKYRPKSLDDLAINKENKDLLKGYLAKPLAIPSFIFYSNSPGTGKTTTAKVIAKELNCDILILNASDERGIDTIRDKVNNFVYSLSSVEGIKRLVFLDEADGLTKQALDSLRNLMESCSDNSFFILSCNDLSKLIDPIKSRCISINFEKPDEILITDYLHSIVKQESLKVDDEWLQKLQSFYYPDIRTMVLKLQNHSLGHTGNELEEEQLLKEFYHHLKTKNIASLYEFVYSRQIDLFILNRSLFKTVFENHEKYDLNSLTKLADKLADTEKYCNLGANKEVVFLSNLVSILDTLSV